MKAITTKYLPATPTKPCRISASDMDGNRIIVNGAGLSDYTIHLNAAKALSIKMEWGDGRNLIGGEIKGGYVWVRPR